MKWKIKIVWNHQPESDLNLKMVILNFAKKKWNVTKHHADSDGIQME